MPLPKDHYRLVGAVLGDTIRVERVVARGGFGLVYRGFHTGFQRPVAVKVLRLGDEHSDAVREEFHARFVKEAELIYGLAHPAIVRVLHFGVSTMPNGEAAPWMVLEWLDGVTLAQLLRDRQQLGPFTRDEALALLRPAIEALAFAHAHGVAHRDVTPANLFVCQESSGPRMRLIDFGVARVMETHDAPGAGGTATQSTITAFSRAYAAPEQFSHSRTGPWTDVHALGLILSEMLTLRAPYPSHDNNERLMAALSLPRPTPGARGVDVGSWEPVLTRALALRPDHRYPDAQALLDALTSDPAPTAVLVPRSASRWVTPALLVVAGLLGATAWVFRDSASPEAVGAPAMLRIAAPAVSAPSSTPLPVVSQPLAPDVPAPPPRTVAARRPSGRQPSSSPSDPGYMPFDDGRGRSRVR
jgi:serine/threonine protein kinase